MSEAPDILERLNAACGGHPNARIPWPHRLLHDAVAEIARLRAELADLRADKEWRPRSEAEKGKSYLFYSPGNRNASVVRAKTAHCRVDYLVPLESGAGWQELPEAPYTHFVPLPAPPQDGGENG